MSGGLNDKINQMRGVSNVNENRMSPDEVAVTKVLMRKARLDQETASRVAKEALGSKKNSSIVVGDNEIKTCDLAYQLARSTQSIESETDPMEEYFAWIKSAKDIALNMTDGKVTSEDLSDKVNFLDGLDVRETEMKAVMALYRNSEYPDAKKRLSFLEYKWRRLLEIRAGLKNNTKNEVSAEPLTPAEKINAQAAIVVFSNVHKQTSERVGYGDFDWQENNKFAFENNDGFSVTYVSNKMLMQYGFINGVQLQKSMADRMIELRSKNPSEAAVTKDDLVNKIKAYRMGMTSYNEGENKNVVNKRVLTVDRMRQIMHENREYA